MIIRFNAIFFIISFSIIAVVFPDIFAKILLAIRNFISWLIPGIDKTGKRANRAGKKALSASKESTQYLPTLFKILFWLTVLFFGVIIFLLIAGVVGRIVAGITLLFGAIAGFFDGIFNLFDSDGSRARDRDYYTDTYSKAAAGDEEAFEDLQDIADEGPTGWLQRGAAWIRGEDRK